MTVSYLVPWRWDGAYAPPHWYVPDNPLSSIDLRSRPQMSNLGGPPEGYALATYPNPITNPNAVFLSDDPTGAMSLTRRRSMAQELGFPIRDLDDVSSLSDAIWEVTTQMCDPTGRDHMKPLMPTVAGLVNLHLGAVGRSQRFDPSNHPRVFELVVLDYNKLKILCQSTDAQLQSVGLSWEQIQTYRRTGSRGLSIVPETVFRSLDRLTPPDHAPKYLDSLCTKYRTDPAGLGLPGELRGIAGTTIEDTFVEGSDTSLDAHTATGPNSGFSWTETAGDMTVIAAVDLCRFVADSSDGRADQDLSSDDHTSEGTFDSFSNSGEGTLTRFESVSLFDWYNFASEGGGSSIWRIWKRVNDSFSIVDSNATGWFANADHVNIGKSDGSDHTYTVDGTVRVGPTSDTAVTGNLRCGFRGYEDDEVDLFKAEDLAAGGPAFTPRAMVY